MVEVAKELPHSPWACQGRVESYKPAMAQLTIPWPSVHEPAQALTGLPIGGDLLPDHRAQDHEATQMESCVAKHTAQQVECC